MNELSLRYRTIADETLRLENEERERRRDDDLPARSKPRPPASATAIASAEKKRKKPFHPSHRAFLRTFDGWEHFAWGLSLFGTAEMLGPRYERDWEVGKLDEALDCVKAAKAGGYEHFAKMRVDDDLAPLAKRKAFQDLFVSLKKKKKQK